MKNKLAYAVKTDRGLVREKNEDSYLCSFHDDELPAIFAIADGMGGHSHGEVASKIAVEYCEKRLAQDLGVVEQEDRVESLLVDTVQKANVKVYLHSLEEETSSGMGTTLTLCVFYPESLYMVHVGDSRFYIYRKGVIEQLSRDHTLVQEMRDAGTLTEQECAKHPQRHILTQALGVPEYLKPETLKLDFKQGDRYLICSDGLHGYVEDEQIEEVMSKSETPEECVDQLMDLALAKGGLDNITLIVVFV